MTSAVVVDQIEANDPMEECKMNMKRIRILLTYINEIIDRFEGKPDPIIHKDLEIYRIRASRPWYGNKFGIKIIVDDNELLVGAKMMNYITDIVIFDFMVTQPDKFTVTRHEKTYQPLTSEEKNFEMVKKVANALFLEHPNISMLKVEQSTDDSIPVFTANYPHVQPIMIPVSVASKCKRVLQQTIQIELTDEQIVIIQKFLRKGYAINFEPFDTEIIAALDLLLTDYEHM